MMVDSVEHILALTPIISSALKAADSFSSAVKSSLVIVQGLGNLGDQLQALESMSENHPVILSQPDLLTRLRYSIEKSLEEEARKMTNFLEKLRIARDQLHKQANKSRKTLKEKQDSVDSVILHTRTEIYPSVVDITLWVEALYQIVNEDYESRLLLIKSTKYMTSEKILELSMTWRWNDRLVEFTKELRAYCYHMLPAES